MKLIRGNVLFFVTPTIGGLEHACTKTKKEQTNKQTRTDSLFPQRLLSNRTNNRVMEITKVLIIIKVLIIKQQYNNNGVLLVWMLLLYARFDCLLALAFKRGRKKKLIQTDTEFAPPHLNKVRLIDTEFRPSQDCKAAPLLPSWDERKRTHLIKTCCVCVLALSICVLGWSIRGAREWFWSIDAGSFAID